jgi:hypothetical protein
VGVCRVSLMTHTLGSVKFLFVHNRYHLQITACSPLLRLSFPKHFLGHLTSFFPLIRVNPLALIFDPSRQVVSAVRKHGRCPESSSDLPEAQR